MRRLAERVGGQTLAGGAVSRAPGPARPGRSQRARPTDQRFISCSILCLTTHLLGKRWPRDTREHRSFPRGCLSFFFFFFSSSSRTDECWSPSRGASILQPALYFATRTPGTPGARSQLSRPRTGGARACTHPTPISKQAPPPTLTTKNTGREAAVATRARRRAARPGLPPPSSSSPSPHPISIPSRPHPRATRPATGPSTGDGERENERERGQPVSLSCSARPVSQSPPSPPSLPLLPPFTCPGRPARRRSGQ